VTRSKYLGLVSLLVLAGCVVGPNYEKPAVDVPPAWKPESPWRRAAPDDAALKGPWWKIFGDAELNTLEQAALEYNPSLDVAKARLRQAQDVVKVTSAGLFPQLGLVSGAQRLKISKDRPVASFVVPNVSTVQNDFTLGFSVQYEADLFGGIKRQLESASASAQQSQADFENARLVLSAELAADYFNLRELDLEIDVIRQSITSENRALEFVRSRHDLGDASGLDLAQQEAQVKTTITQIDLLRNRRAQYEHALATLMGTPAPGFEITPARVELEVPAIPVAVPSDVIQRRPDVASQERAMAAANAQIGVARAAFFPSVPLSANLGLESNTATTLLSASSLFWSFGVSAVQTIFDAGQRQANLDYAKAGYAAVVAGYRGTVLNAMQEVEDGLSGMSTLGSAAEEADAAVTSAQRVLDLANDRYSGGVATYLDVVAAQQALLANQRQAVQIRGQEMVTAVYLIKALGGGWSASP